MNRGKLWKAAATMPRKKSRPLDAAGRTDQAEDQPGHSADDYDLAVFLFDRRVFDETKVGAALCELQRRGLDLLSTADLAAFPAALHHQLDGQSARFEPHHTTAAVVLDVLPQAAGPTPGGSANLRIARCMSVLRQLAAACADGPEASAAVKVLRGGAARNLAETIDAAGSKDLRQRIAREVARFRTGDCLQMVKAGDRSLVQLIDWRGQTAIRKIYRSSSLHLMRQAVDVLENLGPHAPQLAQLLEKGPHHIVVEYVAGGSTLAQRSRRFPRPLPLRRVRKLADFVRHCIASGFDPVDLSPGTNLIWIGDDFRVIDCEFWRRCDPCLPPEQSASLRGWTADDLTGPMTSWVRDPYQRRWIAFVCLDLHSFLYDPPWLQRIKRPFVFARLVPRAVAYAWWYRTAAAFKTPSSSPRTRG
jgi:hypothetical protein